MTHPFTSPAASRYASSATLSSVVGFRSPDAAAKSRHAQAVRLFSRLGASVFGQPGEWSRRAHRCRTGLLTLARSALPFRSGKVVQNHLRSTTMNQPLPLVVEFDHRYDVKLERIGNITHLVAQPITSKLREPRHMQDLPFVNLPANKDYLAWWCFEKASNYNEAVARGKFFFESYVRFARGTQRKRPEDAARLLGYILRDMPNFPDGQDEARVFKACLAEAAVAHLRYGVDA